MSDVANSPMISSDWSELDTTFLPRPGSGSAGTLRIEVGSVGERGEAASDTPADPRLVFPSYELFHRILSPNRMAVIATLAGCEPLSIREVARRVGRDFKGVYSDISALLESGLVQKSDGRISFPFDAIRIDFTVSTEDRSAA